jgi:hypothetical protein
MPGTIRPIKAATKIAYSVLKTQKEKRQRNEKRPPEKMEKAWERDAVIVR